MVVTNWISFHMFHWPSSQASVQKTTNTKPQRSWSWLTTSRMIQEINIWVFVFSCICRYHLILGSNYVSPSCSCLTSFLHKPSRTAIVFLQCSWNICCSMADCWVLSFVEFLEHIFKKTCWNSCPRVPKLKWKITRRGSDRLVSFFW